jgi:paraquat-inducible protein B
MRTSPSCDAEHAGRRREPVAEQRRRRTALSEVAAVWLLPILGVAVLALVWLV